MTYIFKVGDWHRMCCNSSELEMANYLKKEYSSEKNIPVENLSHKISKTEKQVHVLIN